MKIETFRISVEVKAPVYEGDGDFPRECFAIDGLYEQLKLAMSYRYLLQGKHLGKEEEHSKHFVAYQENHIKAIEHMMTTIRAEKVT